MRKQSTISKIDWTNHQIWVCALLGSSHPEIESFQRPRGNQINNPAGSLDTSRLWSWKADTLAKETGTIVIDVCAATADLTTQQDLHLDNLPTRSAQHALLWDTPSVDDYNSGAVLVKILLPQRSGYVVEPTVLAQRLGDCAHVRAARSFVAPGQFLEGFTVATYASMDLQALLAHCYGAVVVPSGLAASTAVNDELVERLSYEWLSPAATGGG